MKKLQSFLLFGLVLIFISGCSKMEIQPDPLNVSDDAFLKNAKVEKKKSKDDHYVPFKGSFEIKAFYNSFGPVKKILEKDWPFTGYPVGMPKGTYLDIEGSGNATHLGLTEVSIAQWWTKAPNLTDGISYGQGIYTFTAANGDQLKAIFWGTADHTDDSDGTEIHLRGTFINGGTGKFEFAKGEFDWIGLFEGHGVPLNPQAGIFPKIGTEMGVGTVNVSGTIMY